VPGCKQGNLVNTLRYKISGDQLEMLLNISFNNLWCSVDKIKWNSFFAFSLYDV